jgi:hypothetical protein
MPDKYKQGEQIELVEEAKKFPFRRTLLIIAIVLIFLLLIAFPRKTIETCDKEFNLLLFTILFFLSFSAEYVSSTVGEGYGLFLAPSLIILGFDPIMIIPAILLSEFVNAIFTTIAHQHFGNADFNPKKRYFKIAVVFSISGIIGAIIAAFVAITISTLVLKIFIASIFLITGVLILTSEKIRWKFSYVKVVFLGLIASFNKALAGGGFGPVTTGGQIIMDIKPKRAVAVSKFAKGLTCLAGFLAYYFIDKSCLNWYITLPMLIGAALAAPLSGWTVDGLKHEILKDIIAIITFILGGMIIVFIFF